MLNVYDVASHSTLHWRENISYSYIDDPVYEFFNRKNKGLNKVYKGIYGLIDGSYGLITLCNYDYVCNLQYLFNNKKIYRAGSNYNFQLRGSSTDGRRNGFMCEYRRKSIIFNTASGNPSGVVSQTVNTNRFFSWIGINYYILVEYPGNNNDVYIYWRSGGSTHYKQAGIAY